MNSQPKVFYAEPIYHERHKFTTYLLKFKLHPFNKIKTDFLRAAISLTSIQNGGDCNFLVVPKFPENGNNGQPRRVQGQTGGVILIKDSETS